MCFISPRNELLTCDNEVCLRGIKAKKVISWTFLKATTKI